MARKEIILDIQDREQLLTFKIREMPAIKLERWIFRAVLLLAGSGAQVPSGADLQDASRLLEHFTLGTPGKDSDESLQPNSCRAGREHSPCALPTVQQVFATVTALTDKKLAALGNVDFEKAEPLLDELLGCCSRLVENIEERCTPQSVDAYILDVKTLFRLRLEAIKLNLGFLEAK